MEGRTRLADYRSAVLTFERSRLVLSSLLARFPIAMVGFSTLLYVQKETGSFAIGGVVSAGFLLGVSAGAVTQGRVIDRRGPTQPLLLAALIFTTAVTGLVVAIELHLPTWLMALGSCLAGASEPKVNSASRTLWRRLLPSGAQYRAALSYEAISMEVFFMFGPALSALLITAAWPGTGVVIGASCMVVGTVMFALMPEVRAWRSSDSMPHTSGLGELANPGVMLVSFIALGLGIVIGFVEVAAPAAAYAADVPTAGGLLLSLWSIASVGFGLIFTLRPWPRAMRRRLPFLLACFSVCVGLLSLPNNLWPIAAGMIIAGALVTPQFTSISAAVDIVAEESARTEAVGWTITATTIGLSLGQSASGYVAEHYGSNVSFLIGGLGGALIAGLAWLRRKSFRPKQINPMAK